MSEKSTTHPKPVMEECGVIRPERQRWDYRVTIRYKNSALATSSNPYEEQFIKQLWPDQSVTRGKSSARSYSPIGIFR
jgi:hypothetical protein